jgi:hypothetical protein
MSTDFGLYEVTVVVATRIHAGGPGVALSTLENRVRAALVMEAAALEADADKDSLFQINAGTAERLA